VCLVGLRERLEFRAWRVEIIFVLDLKLLKFKLEI
jgi:hypothetical protein